MLTIKLELEESWQTLTAGEHTLALKMRRMGHLEKMSAASVIRQDLGKALGMLFDATIVDWRDVCAPPPAPGRPPQPIPFSREGLDILLAQVPELGPVVNDRVLEFNGLADPAGGPDADPTHSASSSEAGLPRSSASDS